MAKNTNPIISTYSFYQIFPRAYSNEGTLKAIANDLKRIKSMGFDFVYLMPIHPIGIKNRKGTYGSPYAIRDYYAINEEYGTMEDFEFLIKEAHKKGLKIMMDIVINHSSPDNAWVTSHPEYYIQDENGHPTNRVKDWSDVVDFNYESKGLRKELLNMLSFYSKKGVDGYRCDVAPMVPMDFWIDARKKVSEINPDTVWIAESSNPAFTAFLRKNGVHASSDYAMYEAFDICYSYDTHYVFMDSVKKSYGLSEYEHLLNLTQGMYPENAIKLRHLENHDMPRIHGLVKNTNAVYNWVAFSFLFRGAAFVYAGQEANAAHTPSLFEKEPVNWKTTDKNYISLIQSLNKLRHQAWFSKINYANLLDHKNYLELLETTSKNEYIGIFNVYNEKGNLKTSLIDGTYKNMINGQSIIVKDQCIPSEACPLFVKK